MVVVLKEGATKEEIEKIDKMLFKKKDKIGFNAKKFNGLISSLGDPLAIQKKMRDEWQRYIG